MLTEFVKILRKILIDRDETLQDMAMRLEITKAYLSAVERGNRRITEGLLDLIIQLYRIEGTLHEELQKAALANQEVIRFRHCEERTGLGFDSNFCSTFS